MKHMNKNSCIAVAVAVLLSACGNGSSPTFSPPSVPAPTPAPTPVDLQTSVAALTYTSSSPEFEFVSSLNSFRGQVGLGLLAQNALLDKSALNHLQYVLTNDTLNGGTVEMRSSDPNTGRPMFHIENAANQGFTGIQELDRAKFAGYSGVYVGEEVSFGGGRGGKVALDGLTSAVYHRAGLMFEGLREVGVAAGRDRSQTITLEFGYSKPQANSSDFFGTFPADNQTGIGLHAGVESPNPFPELSTSNADFPTKTGYPVSVVAQNSATLEVVAFTLVGADRKLTHL